MQPSFTHNEQRGCSYIFNFAALKHFVSENKLLCVIRAHEAQPEGYCLYRAHPHTNFPCMLSIFSAPNYCDTFGNKGAIALVGDGQIKVKQFFSSPHPYVLPNFINAFQWSVPFVCAKAEEVASQLLEIDEADEQEVTLSLQVLQSKIKSSLRSLEVRHQRRALRRTVVAIGLLSMLTIRE